MPSARKAARPRPRHGLLLGVLAVVMLSSAPAALAHIERASYWPDPGFDSAGGQPTGGKVPDALSLFSALDSGALGETRVVCVGGQALPYRADQDVTKRPDQHVSRDKVDRLKKKKKKLRRKVEKASGEEADRLRHRLRKVRKRYRRAKKEYEAALAAELAAREQAQREYEEALAAELAAREAYQQALGAQPSIQALDASLADAVANGYVLRPSEPPITVTQQEADELRDFNARLLAECRYDSIQAAINDSGNNDRVVVMPGLYPEPESRAAPTDDPACDGLEEVNDRGQTGANSYRYTAKCPNDQMLIAVIGREPGPDPPPQPPLDDRHGIPDEGPCIRCNLQLEGSGVSPDDVVVDAGNVDSGNGAPPDPVKDVVLKIDRADGFVLRNMTLRHAAEHGIYPHEVDGYLLERFKVPYNEEYGVLAFASDHGLIQDCDAFGSGDAGIYPGSAPDTGEQGEQEDGTPQRLNTEIRNCDMRHNAAGYSGTAANAVWIHHNDFYDNALGFTTDVFTAAGHPGFPQDSDLIENNEFYSNNFNPYETDQPEDTEVVPTIPVPVGTGLWIAGGNNNTLRNNFFWDNWRRGTMVFSVPDAFVCGPQTGNSQHGCDPNEVNTSYDNEHHDNVMGRTPGGTPDPNGTDFWWDQFAGNTGNCWFDNVGKNGDRASLTADPPLFPAAGTSTPGFLPEDCDSPTNTGGGGDNETELLNCLANFEEGAPTPCTWFTTPPEPQP